MKAMTLLTGLALAATSCVGQVDDTQIEDLDTAPLDHLFDQAATEHDVPAVLLAAISYVETRWSMVEGDEHDGVPAAFGVMALRADRIDRAAALLGRDADDVRYDAETNIRGAAALLAAEGKAYGLSSQSDLGAWAQAVGDYSGIEDDDARRSYVVHGVYEVLRSGASLVDEEGTAIVTLPATDVTPDYPSPEILFYGTSDYPAGVWRPSPNNSARPSGTAGKVSAVIIHTCEGGYAGCWGWLRNSAAGASAHYVVKENGAEITQLVRESRKAWHIAATYSCSRNGNQMCSRNGQSSNNFTVGIEHGGYASQSSWPSSQIEASAKLVCDITRDHSVARDKYHIVGHGQLQPWNRTDPGRNWPWTHYINRVRAHCGSSGGGGGTSTGSSFVVDSNNSRNDRTKGYVEAPSSWAASNSTPGYYGTGYWWASTKPVSDGTVFYFYLDSAQSRTIDAWWTAGSNRSSAAPFVAFNAQGQVVGRAYADERQNGQRWNTLGSWSFTQGWNKIVASRWAPEGKVVIADAVRIR